MIAQNRYSYVATSIYSRARIDRAGLAFTRALCAYTWRMNRDSPSRPDDVEAAFAVAQIEAPEWLWATDTGNTNTLWRFSFGAYGCTHVYVLGDGNMSDALESAAAELSPGFFTEPNYREAADDLGLPESEWSGDGLCSEAVCSKAEEDLTYTESGYLASWEWNAYKISIADLHEWLDDRIVRGRAKIGETYVDFFPSEEKPR